MKNVIRLLITSALAAVVFALPAFAQDTTATPAAAATASTQCDEKTKADIYERWRNSRKGDPAAQKVAYEAGKEFLTKCGSQNDEYVKAVQKWVGNYEGATREFNFNEALKKKDYATAFRLGREIMSAQPDRLSIPVVLGWSGYLASTENNNSFNADAMMFAQQAAKAIESGKQPMGLDASGKEVVSWAPFTTREDTLGGLYFALGSFVTKANRPEEAITYFYNAAQQNGFTKKEPNTYANLAAAYELSQYKKYADQYRIMTEKDPKAVESPEAKDLLAKLDQVSDRIIDAYGRAIALATDAKYAAQKASWMKKLTALYKFRHNDSEAGLNEYLAGVLNQPMPGVFTATDTPATTPATSGGVGAGNGGSMTTPATTPARTGAATTVNTTTTTTTTAQPVSTAPKPATTPATANKPKP